jgi:hypothetical protein
MHSDQAPYRELVESMWDYEGSTVYADLLAPWSEANRAEEQWFRSFAERTGDPIPSVEIEDLWRLYALSRVNETLLLRFQHGRADGTDYQGPEISLKEYLAFMIGLGFRRASEASFSPFFHEIVEVDTSSGDDVPITLVGEFWPALMLGDMMFSRAGVQVGGGRKHIRKEIAETSTLYWAYRRKNRPYNDLSQGWGSNSQWRTDFRRDYRIEGKFFFNANKKHDLREPAREEDRDGLTRGERIELLVHRCLITVDKPHHDLWPFDDFFVSAAP